MTDERDEDEDKPTELKRLFVREISLVDKPANRRRFLLFKSAEGPKGGTLMADAALSDEAALALEEALNSEAEREDELMEALETIAKAEKAELSDADKNAVKGALRLLAKVKNAVGDAVMKKLAALAGYGYAAPEKANPKKKPEEEEEDYGTKRKAAVKKESVPAEVLEIAKAASTSEEYESIVKAAQESPATVGLLLQVLQKSNEARDTELKELKKFQVDVLAKEDDRRAREQVTEMDLPGMAIEDQIAFVKSLDGAARDRLAQWAKGLRASVSEALTTEIGTPRRAFAQAGSALDEIQKRASQLVEKAAGKLSAGDAMMKVMEDDPALAERYRSEVLGRGG